MSIETTQQAAARAKAAPRPVPLAALARGRVAAATVFPSDFDTPRRAPAPPPEPEPAPEPEVIQPSFSLDEVEAARKLAHAEGESEGRRTAESDATARIAASLARIEAMLTEVAADARAQAERNAEATVRLVLGALKAAFPAHAARLGPAELEAAARALLPSLVDEKRVLVRAHPGEAEAIAARLSDAIASDHLELAIEARPDPRIEPGDGRIVWTGAEARREARAIWRDIEDSLAAFGLEPAHARELRHEPVPAPAEDEPAARHDPIAAPIAPSSPPTEPERPSHAPAESRHGE